MKDYELMQKVSFGIECQVYAVTAWNVKSKLREVVAGWFSLEEAKQQLMLLQALEERRIAA